jgi:hypothetical protein
LGFCVDDHEPVGEAHEVEASIGNAPAYNPLAAGDVVLGEDVARVSSPSSAADAETASPTPTTVKRRR